MKKKLDGFIKIKFKIDYATEVVTRYDAKKDAVETEDTTFKTGEVHEVDVLDDKGKGKNRTLDVQFGNGDCLYGLSKSAIEVIK